MELCPRCFPSIYKKIMAHKNENSSLYTEPSDVMFHWSENNNFEQLISLMNYEA